MAAADWERLRSDTFAIPETMELKEIVAAIEAATTLDHEQRHQLEKTEIFFGETALDVLEKILGNKSIALGLQKSGEVSEPVRAFILVAGETGLTAKPA